MVERRNLSSFVKKEAIVEAGLKVRGFITYHRTRYFLSNGIEISRSRGLNKCEK